MDYNGYQPETTTAQIRSTRGETIDLSLPRECTVGELLKFLIEEYGYDPRTRFLYNSRPAANDSYVCDYPHGSLIIASPADAPQQQQRQPLPPRPKSSSARNGKNGNVAAQPQQQRVPPRSTSTHSNGSDSQAGRPKSANRNAPPSPPTPEDAASSPPMRDRPSPSGGRTAPSPSRPAAAPTTAEEDEVNHRQRTRFTVECHIPSLDRVLTVDVNGESSVVDLVLAVVAAAPEIGGQARVVFRGKVLPQNAQAKLFDLGMRADTRVFIAAGAFANPETITLLEIEKDTSEIEKAMQSSLTTLQRKGFYEELMRILFRTDGLQTLEGEWRQRRKDAVKKITTLQDALNVESKEA